MPFLYFIGFVIFMFLVIFLPYDWWQKSPARQPDRFIGKILPFLNISIRNIVLRFVFLVFTVIIYLYSIIWVPFIVGMVILVAIFRSLWVRIRGRSAEPVIGLIIILSVMCMFAVGIIAPLRLVPITGYLVLGKPAGNFWETLTIGKEWVTVDTIIGLCGILGVASWLLVDAIWRFRQARQVENLATSKISALAIGLVEVKGAVRPVAGSGQEPAVELSYGMFGYIKPSQKIERFLLEDKTGSVLVDATECRVRAGWISEVATIFGVREIVLSRRIERDDFSDAVRKKLLYGDRIYVIGNAERDQSGSLVIRPATRSSWNEVLWNTLFGAIKPPKGKDIHDVFFITDGDEKRAKKHILKGLRTVLLWGLIWIISSATVIWMAQQPWRKAPPLDSWRNAYWRGSEPNPSPMIIDYTRNERLFRFERYMKTIDNKSIREIPALMEAISYRDYRFYEPATWALHIMKTSKERMSDAVPLLVKNLHSCAFNAKSLQTTILVLGSFGPLAELAVPGLIEQLKCQQTNTYEVTPNIIRFQAARALGEIGAGAEEAIPALKEVLSDPSPFVRDTARYALKKIEQGLSGEQKRTQKVPGWIRLPSRGHVH